MDPRMRSAIILTKKLVSMFGKEAADEIGKSIARNIASIAYTKGNVLQMLLSSRKTLVIDGDVINDKNTPERIEITTKLLMSTTDDGITISLPGEIEGSVIDVLIVRYVRNSSDSDVLFALDNPSKSLLKEVRKCRETKQVKKTVVKTGKLEKKQ